MYGVCVCALAARHRFVTSANRACRHRQRASRSVSVVRFSKLNISIKPVVAAGHRFIIEPLPSGSRLQHCPPVSYPYPEQDMAVHNSHICVCFLPIPISLDACYTHKHTQSLSHTVVTQRQSLILYALPFLLQSFPDISNRTAALLSMPKGRYQHLKRLQPLLANQSEDCLTLNIYVPGSGKLQSLSHSSLSISFASNSIRRFTSCKSPIRLAAPCRAGCERRVINSALIDHKLDHYKVPLDWKEVLLQYKQPLLSPKYNAGV